MNVSGQDGRGWGLWKDLPVKRETGGPDMRVMGVSHQESPGDAITQIFFLAAFSLGRNAVIVCDVVSL